jgi:hypothetical protein
MRCACCGQPGPCDAAHIRAGSLAHDKPQTGMARKPDDKWALPLRHAHHMAQHRYGDEVGWWKAHGIDPFATAVRYYKQYGGDGGKPQRKRVREIDYPVSTATNWRNRPWPKQEFPTSRTRRIPARPFSKRKQEP